MPMESKELKQMLRASDVMQTEVATISRDELAVDAAQRMMELKIGCLPVVEGDKLVGFITEPTTLSWWFGC